MNSRAFHCMPVFVFSAALILGASIAFGETAEETLAKLNRLPAAERQAALVKEAKKEGAVIWYAPMNRDSLREFTAAFEADYPFIKVQLLTSGPQRLLNRILTEYRAGKFSHDLMNIRSSALYTMKQAKVIMRYNTPYRRDLRGGFYDQEGYFNGIWATPLVHLFNTKQVSREQAPKNLTDLLQLKWKGKLAMDKDADDWLAAIMDYYGDEKGKQFAKGLGGQELQIRDGRTLLAQLVAAGEFPVQIDGHLHEALQLKKSGAPVDYWFPEPFIPVKAASAFTLSSHPLNPHAAALLVDFMISKKGQEIAYRQGRWPAHKDVATSGPDSVGNRKTVIPDAEKWGSRYDELVGLLSLLKR